MAYLYGVTNKPYNITYMIHHKQWQWNKQICDLFFKYWCTHIIWYM